MPPNATGEPDKDVGETIAHDHDANDDAEIMVPISEAVVVLSKDAVTAGLEEFFRDQLSQHGVEVVHRVRERLSRGRSVKLAQLVSVETHSAAIEQAQEALLANESKEEDADVAANALEGKEGERESKHDEDRNDDTFDEDVDNHESEQKVASLEEKTSDSHHESTKAKSDGRSSTGDIRTNAAKLAEEVSLVLSQPQFADKVKRLAKAHVCRGDEHALALVCRGPGARHAIARVLDREVLRAKVDELGLQMFDVDPVQVAAKAAEEAAAAIAEQEGDNGARKGQAGKDKRNKAAPEGDTDNNPGDKLIPQSPLLFLSSSLPRFDQGLRNFFCTAPAPLGDDAEAFGDSSSRVVSRKNVMVHLDQLIQFMFPTNLQHPRSTGRLLLFGEFGPLDEDSNLRCGAQGMHVVRRYELNALGKQIEEEDLLDIFAPGEVLAADQKAEVLREVTKTLCNTSQITKREVHKLFKDTPRNREGLLSFHDMQSTIHDFRKQRINEMKRASTGAAVQQPRTKKDMSFEELQELCKHEAAVRQAVREALRPAPKVGESDAYVVVTRLLHRNTHKIANLEDKNHPSLVLNARLLGEDRKIPGTIPWKPVLGRDRNRS